MTNNYDYFEIFYKFKTVKMLIEFEANYLPSFFYGHDQFTFLFIILTIIHFNHFYRIKFNINTLWKQTSFSYYTALEEGEITLNSNIGESMFLLTIFISWNWIHWMVLWILQYYFNMNFWKLLNIQIDTYKNINHLYLNSQNNKIDVFFKHDVTSKVEKKKEIGNVY